MCSFASTTRRRYLLDHSLSELHEQSRTHSYITSRMIREEVGKPEKFRAYVVRERAKSEKRPHHAWCNSWTLCDTFTIKQGKKGALQMRWLASRFHSSTDCGKSRHKPLTRSEARWKSKKTWKVCSTCSKSPLSPMRKIRGDKLAKLIWANTSSKYLFTRAAI